MRGRRLRRGATAADPDPDHVEAVLGWPFDPREGQWAIVNGYRGTGQHAAATDGKPNPARFALDFARCGDDSIDVGRGICANASDELGWDRVATRGATVLSPIDGTIAYVGELTPTCPYVAIAVPDRPGYEVVLVNVAGAPTDGEVVRGDPIGTVAAGTCGEAGDGDYLLMAVYARFDGDEPDPNAAAEGVPFADDWEIDGCAYPDNKRTANQYLGELVPCQPPSTGQSRANA